MTFADCCCITLTFAVVAAAYHCTMSALNENHPTVACVINDEEKNGEEEKEENEPPLGK
jgi:hypothetical protein